MILDVLVIDDDPGMIELITEQVNKNFLGIRIVSASSGLHAIELLKKKTDFELVISDYSMSDGNGVDVLNYLIDKKHSIFFVLHTSHLGVVLPDDPGDFFLGVVEKMNFDELNLILMKLFVS